MRRDRKEAGRKEEAQGHTSTSIPPLRALPLTDRQT